MPHLHRKHNSIKERIEPLCLVVQLVAHPVGYRRARRRGGNGLGRYCAESGLCSAGPSRSASRPFPSSSSSLSPSGKRDASGTLRLPFDPDGGGFQG
jgi:hypothetical protein